MGVVIEFKQKIHILVDKIMPLILEKCLELNLRIEIDVKKQKELDNLYLKFNVTKKDLEQYQKTDL